MLKVDRTLRDGSIDGWCTEFDIDVNRGRRVCALFGGGTGISFSTVCAVGSGWIFNSSFFILIGDSI